MTTVRRTKENDTVAAFQLVNKESVMKTKIQEKVVKLKVVILLVKKDPHKKTTHNGVCCLKIPKDRPNVEDTLTVNTKT